MQSETCDINALKHSSLKPELIDSLKRIGSCKASVWVEAYGCSASMADSEMISGMLKAAGYELARKENEAGLNIIVTCSVKDKTEHRMASRILHMRNSGKPLVVAGCLPKADEMLVRSLAPRASLMGPHSIDRTVEVASMSVAGQRLVALDDSKMQKANVPRVRINPAVSIVEIASGCLSECSFCQTKLAKGQLRSYRPTDIAAQIRNDLGEGCREIWLTSTDNGCYGYDIGTDLAELLTGCSGIIGDYMIRVGMMNPMYLPNVTGKLVRAFSSPRIYRFLHIPVQSGSDAVLRDMKRGHTSETFLNAVRAFRTRFPEICIATDIIVGFPTEGTEDFEMTMELIREAEPDVINISRYSARPGTVAARMKRLGTQTSKARSQRAHIITRGIAMDRNSLWSGWQGEIMIDEIEPGVVHGHNFAYKPVVVKSDTATRLMLGQKINVRVTEFSSYALKAEII